MLTIILFAFQSSGFPGFRNDQRNASEFHVYVVVQFHPWFKFYFPLFLGMVMYDNDFETKENKI